MNAKLILLVSVLIAFSSSNFGQRKREAKESINVESDTHDVKEKAPKFPGGMQKLYDFIYENVKYPEEAKKTKLEGKVYVQYTVLKDGRISDAKVVKGVHLLLDTEALRVINLMPNWLPGTSDGKEVDVKYTLPINFKL